MAEKNRKELDEIKSGVGSIEMPPGMDIPTPDIPNPEDDMPEFSAQPNVSEIPSINQQNIPQPMMMNPQFDLSEKLHEIAEAIIDERWNDFTKRVGNIAVWQEKTNMNLSSIKQELIRTQERFENLQKGVIGKVSEYDEGIRSVHTEMKALEKVFERILEPLVKNVKELGNITEELKRIKK